MNGKQIGDLTGKRFGRLIVVSRSENINRHKTWLCRCDCGVEKIIGSSNLIGGTKSCGCLKRETIINIFTTHGMTKSPERMSWKAAKARCFNKNSDKYRDYGGRGITMCSRWVNSFQNFYDDMGVRPPGTSLDRIDNDGNYEPGNCKWSTPKEQQRNRRPYRIHDRK